MHYQTTTIYKIRAWVVHFYTSLGLATGLLSLFAIFSGNALSFFIFQGASLFIDATDGFFARRWKVKEFAPGLDGRKLDDIIDYLNYSFLPIAFTYQFGLVTGLWSIVLVVVLISSIYGFCQNSAKTNDGYFTGFPNFWNLLIFYLFFAGFSIKANALILLVFALLIFAPIKFVSYSSPIYRKVTLSIGVLYGIILFLIILNFQNVDIRMVWVSLFAPTYYVCMSLYLHLTGKSV